MAVAGNNRNTVLPFRHGLGRRDGVTLSPSRPPRALVFAYRREVLYGLQLCFKRCAIGLGQNQMAAVRSTRSWLGKLALVMNLPLPAAKESSLRPFSSGSGQRAPADLADCPTRVFA